jgi:hypothetical protein
VVAAPAGFAPTDRPRVAVAGDGSLAAIHELGSRKRIVVTEVPSCAQFAELGIDPEATEADVGWVGTPPRLLVLSRYAAHSSVHLVDPFGPRTITEMRLESPMRLCATVGTHALAIGAQGAAVLAASDRGLTPYLFPARAVPVTAGAAGTQFVVALPGAIEEWDPVSRLPKRRLKLPRPAQITAVGGSDRVVWMTTQQEPSRIEVIPLVNRGQPKYHDLSEPIAFVASHPRSDLVACIGASSGRIWVIDLDGRAGLRMVGPEGIDRAEAVSLVLGRVAGVLAAQTRRPLTVVALERQDEQPVAAPVIPRNEGSGPARGSSLTADVEERDLESNTSVTLSSPTVSTTLVTGAAPPAPRPQPKPTASTPTGATSPEIASFRERAHHPRARTVEPPPALWTDVSPRWRDDIAAATRDFMANRPLPSAAPPRPIDAMLSRFDLTPTLTNALVLMYGTHLLGGNGMAPVDIARIAGWPEALGRGELAETHVAIYRDSRVHLAPAVTRALDELVPLTGTIVGTPGVVSLLGLCTIVAGGPLSIIAEACVSSISGAILAAHDGAAPDELVREARAYAAAPMLRVTLDTLASIPVEQPFILVVDDDAIADRLGLPRLT